MATTRDETKPCCQGSSPTDYVSKGEESLLGDMKVYTVGPSSSDNKKPIGILVSYDIFGFDMTGTRQFCDKLAETTGYTVVFGDYFRGNPWREVQWPLQGEKDQVSFMDWVNSFSDEHLSGDITVLRNYLREKGIVKIGVLGFCYGGKVTVLAAKMTGQFQAAATMHGAFIKDDDAKDIDCPLLMVDAGNDPDRTELIKVMKAKDVATLCDFVRFPDMEHGWTNRGDQSIPEVKKAMDEAFDRAVKFFQDCLE